MKRTIVTIFRIIFSILTILLIVYFTLDMFGISPSSFGLPIGSYVDPLLGPIQRVVPRIFGIDFSPLVAILIIGFIEWLIRSLWRDDPA